MIAQDLWQAHYQNLLIILLKQFTKLNVNTDMMIKNVKLGIKGFEIKNLGEYHDLYIQSNILMLAGVFQNVLKYMN